MTEVGGRRGGARPAVFVALTVSTALILAALRAGSFLLPGAVRDSPAPTALGAWLGDGADSFEERLETASMKWRGLAAVTVSLWMLLPVLHLAARSRRRALATPLALVGWWLGVETFGAPHMTRLLRLHNYEVMQDIDHRPRHTGASWNSDHLRGTPEPEEFRPEGLNILFLGDSFTFGFRVKPDEAYPALVGEILAARFPRRGVTVANFGWQSSSPLLSHRRLVEIGAKYEPDFVVLGLDMTDFADDIRYRNMLERRGLYRFYERLPLTLKLVRLCAERFLTEAVARSVGNPPTERFFACEAPLEETRPWLASVVESLDRIRAWSAEHGAEFVLLVLPRAFQHDAREVPRNWEGDRYTVLGPWSLEPFRFFEELAAEVDYPILPVLEDFRASSVFPKYFENDPHWNPAGHGVAARAIAGRLIPLIR